MVNPSGLQENGEYFVCALVRGGGTEGLGGVPGPPWPAHRTGCGPLPFLVPPIYLHIHLFPPVVLPASLLHRMRV